MTDDRPRARRVGESVRKEIASLLVADVKDPGVTGAVVTGVDMTGDLRSARVRVRLLSGGEGEGRRKALLGALRRASGLLRREVAQRLGLRHAPELRFIYDEGTEHMTNVERLLDQIAAERKAGGEKT